MAGLMGLRAVRLAPAGEELLRSVDLEIGSGERICLVGRNGSGKSTLLKALAGLVELDGGERHIERRVTVGYLAQQPVLDPKVSMLDHVLAGLPEHGRDGDALIRAERLLARLALEGERHCSGLSGGEQRRLSLAQVLLAAPDVLLLDEPTNHLDLPAIEWLERELSGYRGAVVMISHDRRVLANLSRVTWWIDRGELRINPEGFAAFETWSGAVLDAEAHELARLDKHLQAEEHWLHRGVTARRKRNQGRLTKLASLRAKKAGWRHQAGVAKLKASVSEPGGATVIEADGVAKAFGGQTIVSGFSTRVQRGDRIGFVGANGSGKTTLLNLLIGALPSDAGRIKLGTNLTIARFDQNRDQLDPDRTPWQVLCPDGGDRLDVNGVNRHVVGYLRDFLFTEAQARTPVRSFSGGERSRLLLAKILAAPSNLLVLDEPTNDLDIETLDLLEEVLGDYAGTLLLVSHDRDFLDRLVTSTIALEGLGRVQEYAGGYSDMMRVRAAADMAASTDAVAKPAKVEPGRGKQAHEARRQHQKLIRELERLPDKIDQISAKISLVEDKLGVPGLYNNDFAAFERLEGERQGLEGQRAGLEERWLELEEYRETAELD